MVFGGLFSYGTSFMRHNVRFIHTGNLRGRTSATMISRGYGSCRCISSLNTLNMYSSLSKLLKIYDIARTSLTGRIRSFIPKAEFYDTASHSVDTSANMNTKRLMIVGSGFLSSPFCTNRFQMSDLQATAIKLECIESGDTGGKFVNETVALKEAVRPH